ncbi:MAG: mercuric reductase [Planctomycetota bacterium]
MLMDKSDYGQVKPRDEHNLELKSNVHPPDWVNPTPDGRYNLVVLGAGTAGLVTAAGAAGLGARVALVERHLMGGDCLNVGCVPSKCLIRSSRAVADARHGDAFGVRVTGDVEVDFPAVMERMRRLRAEISHHDAAARFRDLGVDIYIGEARFAGEDTVEVAGKTLEFARAVICTGARAVDPPIEGLAEAGYLTNETVFNLTERPERLLVIGAGPLGCELAQAFCRLGSEVTVVERKGQPLSKEDPDAAAILIDAFRRDGIRFLLNAQIQRVEVRDGEKVVHVTSDGEPVEVAADAILVGAGRKPNVEGLNLDAVGVEHNKYGVVVNDHLQTTNPDIYAAGDICSRFKFTHTADFAARIVLQNALFFGRKKFSDLVIPWCTYTDPEVAHVGEYEHTAADKGIEVDTFKQELGEVDRAIADGETEGFVKVHLRKGTDRIVGATIVARHAGEMINELSLAIVAGLGLKTIGTIIHPYPTQAEAIRMLADQYNRTRLTPLAKKAFNRFLSWRR